MQQYRGEGQPIPHKRNAIPQTAYELLIPKLPDANRVRSVDRFVCNGLCRKCVPGRSANRETDKAIIPQKIKCLES
jgi:hypothetical protein